MNLTPDEVAERLHLKRATIIRLFRKGDLPAFRPTSRKWLMRSEDLDEWEKARIKNAIEPVLRPLPPGRVSSSFLRNSLHGGKNTLHFPAFA